MSQPAIAVVTDEPFSVATHEDAVAHSAAGATVSFAGVVRDHDGGRTVTELEYVGHPTAQQVISEIAAEFAPHRVIPFHYERYGRRERVAL